MMLIHSPPLLVLCTMQLVPPFVLQLSKDGYKFGIDDTGDEKWFDVSLSEVVLLFLCLGRAGIPLVRDGSAPICNLLMVSLMVAGFFAGMILRILLEVFASGWSAAISIYHPFVKFACCLGWCHLTITMMLEGSCRFVQHLSEMGGDDHVWRFSLETLMVCTSQVACWWWQSRCRDWGAILPPLVALLRGLPSVRAL
ncbi:hypothetical protein Nepgr_006797 [Nepenthes gracilis]|uniref:Uncharacterized protein n=1 Tax=Nepenthes gracilis TaxID=150966 RepID=A0AAD3S5P3_NEPGR|nr:hypothetical protein Nepgr_006797 [Nepenthes gracilis]